MRVYQHEGLAETCVVVEGRDVVPIALGLDFCATDSLTRLVLRNQHMRMPIHEAASRVEGDRIAQRDGFRRRG